MTRTWSQLVAGRDMNVPVVATAEGRWTGAELVSYGAAAADWFDGLGIPPGASVPALVSTSLAATALLMGGAGSGRPLAPVGPRLAVRELAACLAQHDAPVIIAEDEFREQAEAAGARTGQSVAIVPVLGTSTRTLDLDPPDGSLALIMHTSGTSGVPKLVPVRQDRLAARVRNSTPLTGVGPGVVYATMSPFHHIAGIGNVLVTLAAGATLACAPRFSVDTWSTLAAMGVTHAFLAPTMIEMLLADGLLSFPSLRMLQYGGSPIHPATLARLGAALPDVNLVQVYGSTEGSPLTCLSASDHQRAAAGHPELLLSNGKAAPETEVVVATPDAAGVGEIRCRAPHIHVTAADGWLHTGDLGRLDDQGYLYLVGRQGDRIIRGGENVDPIEVEQVIARHPLVREVAVVGAPDRRLGEMVTAFVLAADPAAPPDPAELRAYARSDLAGFKVPERWIVTDDLPRNENGKVLRRILRDRLGA